MVITKFIIAKAQGAGEMEELINIFGTFYIASDEAAAKEFQKYDRYEDLCDYIDTLERARLLCEIDKTEALHIDYTVDLSRLADEASLRLFGKKEAV